MTALPLVAWKTLMIKFQGLKPLSRAQLGHPYFQRFSGESLEERTDPYQYS